MSCYFLVTPDFKGTPGTEESWLSPYKSLTKILCMQPSESVFVLGANVLAWKSWGYESLSWSVSFTHLKSSFLVFPRTTTYSTNTGYLVTKEHSYRFWKDSD